MFNINTEYRKGVLFIRLQGRFDYNYYVSTIDKLVVKFGIKAVVLNLCELKHVSLENINYINLLNKKILKKRIKLLICDKEIRNDLFRNIVKINSEIEAFSLI